MAAPLPGESPASPALPPALELDAAIFALLPVPVFVVAMEAAGGPVILACNEAACASTGYRREELIGQPITLVSGSPLDLEERAELADRMLRGEPATFHSLRRHRDGTVTAVEVRSRAAVLGGRRVVISTDHVVAAPQVALAQEGRNLRLQLALESAEMAVWDWEVGHDAATMPLSPEGGFGGVLPEDTPVVRAALDRALSEGVACRIEFRAYDLQGCVRWLEGRCVPVRDQGGAVVRFLGTVMDITERKAGEQALRESEARLRLALTNARMSIWEWDPATNQGILPDAFTRMLGLPTDEQLTSFAEAARYVHPDDRALLDDALTAAVEEGVEFRIELRFIRPGGGVGWVEAGGAPFFGGDGSLQKLVGTIRDITEQRAAREALQSLNAGLERRVRERTVDLEMANRTLRQEIHDRVQIEAMLRDRERFLERVMAATPSQVYIFDITEPRTIYANRLLDDLGYSREHAERMGPLPILALMHPDDAARVPAIFARLHALADEEVLENEFRARHADGSWRRYATRDVVFARDAAGVPAQILGVGIDITAIKQAEESLAAGVRRIEALNADLRRGSALLSAIVNGLNDGLALLDRYGVVLMANQALAALCEQGLDQVVGQIWPTICPATTSFVELSFANHAPTTARVQLEPHGATATQIDMRTIPLFAADGTVDQLVVHIVDVTERLQYEALAIQNERLATTGRLAATVAHEVNSPLQSIQNFLFLASTDDPAERDSYLGLISDEIDRIGRLIRRLLDLNRPGDEEERPVDVNGLIEKALVLMAGTIARHRVVVHTDLAAKHALVFGRGDQLMQVLLNIVLNALDVMPGGGRLSIHTTNSAPPGEALPDPPDGPSVTIEVADTGPGIPAEVLDQIFKPFFTTKPSGSGIGLAISRQIVEQHGGQLQARNGAASGAVFSAVFPVTGEPR